MTNLITGLGNPGKKYEKTRHNIGFMVLEELRSRTKAFSDWKKSENANCSYSKGEIFGKEIELIKPLTFMNNSGKSLNYAIKKHNVELKDILVIHDDIDLPLGKIKIVANRGSAGHKGVESIIKEIKTKNFARLRIGIQPNSGRPEMAEKFVLQNFKKEEAIKDIIEKSTEIIEFILKEGLENAMNKFNQ